MDLETQNLAGRAFRRADGSAIGGTYRSRRVSRSVQRRGNRSGGPFGILTTIRVRFAHEVRVGMLRMFMSRNEWWPASFVCFSIMGWIFNAFGLGMIIFSFQTDRAWGFFTAGLGMWMLAGIVLGVFLTKPSPSRRHTR